MSEYEHEPVRGLPGHLPPGEHILWQGAPDWKQLAMSALHVRLTALYFVALVVWAIVGGDASMAGVALVSGSAVLGLFFLFAWGVGRTTLYTLTDRRLVLRIGVALNACVNLPLREIDSAQLKILGGGHGSVVLSLKGAPQLGYWMLWPHARSLRVIRPQPMLRAIPDAAGFARLLFTATQKVQPIAAGGLQEQSRPVRGLTGAHA